MRAGIRYWYDKVEFFKEKLVGYNTELEDIREMYAEIERATSIKKKPFLSVKTIEHQIRFNENELTNARRNLRNRVITVKNWYEKRDSLIKQVEDYRLKLENLKLEYSQTLDFISAGVISKDSKLELIIKAPKEIKSLRQHYTLFSNQLKKHLSLKPNDSHKLALEVYAELENLSLDSDANEYAHPKAAKPLENNVRAFGLKNITNTSIPEMLKTFKHNTEQLEELTDLLADANKAEDFDSLMNQPLTKVKIN